MTSSRRMGPPDSAAREAMLDAVEAVLRDEGGDKLTVRRVAQAAGFNHQTVYYYFTDREDLVVAAFRRRVERSLARQEEAARAAAPLHALIDLLGHIADSKVSAEFSSLAARSDRLRGEIVAYLRRSSALHEALLAQALARCGPSAAAGAIDPAAAALLIRALLPAITQEAMMGFTQGHAAARAMIARWLDILEP